MICGIPPPLVSRDLPLSGHDSGILSKIQRDFVEDTKDECRRWKEPSAA